MIAIITQINEHGPNGLEPSVSSRLLPSGRPAVSISFLPSPPSPCVLSGAAVQEERQRNREREGELEFSVSVNEEMPVEKILAAETAVEQKTELHSDGVSAGNSVRRGGKKQSQARISPARLMCCLLSAPRCSVQHLPDRRQAAVCFSGVGKEDPPLL